MAKRTSYDIKKRILFTVKEKPATYAQLERRVNTGFRTIKQNCVELEEFGQVTIDIEKHPANGKEAHLVSITSKGLETVRKRIERNN